MDIGSKYLLPELAHFPLGTWDAVEPDLLHAAQL